MRSLEEINWENNKRQAEWEKRREKEFLEWEKQTFKAIPGIPLVSELPQAPESNLRLTEKDKDFLKSIGVSE